MHKRIAQLAAATLVGVGASTAIADTESWPFDLTTDGDDVFYSSPTAVATTAPRYAATTEISLVEANVTFLIFTDTVDVTDQLDLEELTGVRIIDGPAPVTVFNEQVVFPEPPEDPGVAADITLELDAAGFGQLSVVDVLLDTVEVEIPGFGLQDVTVNSLRVVGNVIVTPIPAGDVNLDCQVNLADLLAVLSNWGTTCPEPDCPGTPCPGDANGDCTANLADLLAVLSNWGNSIP